MCGIVTCPAFGQTNSGSITVTTDKTSYADGDTMTISGTVADQLDVPISIVIRDSSQNPVYIAQTNPNSDNTYSAQAVAGGSLWKNAGQYEIDVTYGGQDRTAKATFEFTGNANSAPNTNQTNATQTIPEFGPAATAIFALSTFAIIIMYTRAKHSFKI